MFALKKPVWRRNKIYSSRNLGFGDFKELTWFRQSFLFSFSPKKAKKKLYSQVNQSKNNWCKQEQQILNSCYRKKQRSGGSRPSDKGGRGGRGGGHPDPEIKAGGAGVSKKNFQPFGPQFGLKIRGGPAPPGPSPGSATEKSDHFCKVTTALVLILVHQFLSLPG